MRNVEDFLKAMRADSIPAGEKGLWNVRKFEIKKFILSPDKKKLIAPGNYTQLSKLTWASINFGGECVMVDYYAELLTHMNFIQKARGRVFVSGLGLGCVLRGLLLKEEVTYIDVVEKNQEVIDLIWPFMPKDERLKLRKADVLKIKLNGESWDYGWHDISTDGNKGLEKKHATLIAMLHSRIKKQGAWNFPRELKRHFDLI